MYHRPSVIAGAFALLISWPAFAGGLVIDPFTTFPPTGGGGATPVVVATSEAYTAAPWTGMTVTKPTGAAEGDLVIVHLLEDDGSGSAGPPSAPDGSWTYVDGGNQYPYTRYHVFWKVLGASEPSTWSFGAGIGGTARMLAVLIDGAASTAPVYLSEKNGATPASPVSTFNCSSITTTGDNELVLNFMQSGSFSGPWTVTVDGSTTNEQAATPLARATATVASFEQAAAGATGTKTHTPATAADSYMCITLAVRP